MNLSIIGQAVALFTVTNIDDILAVALFFAQGVGQRRTTYNIAIGQYLGFSAILAVAVAAAFGATFQPEHAIPYLGFLPLASASGPRYRPGDTTTTPTRRRPPKKAARRSSK